MPSFTANGGYALKDSLQGLTNPGFILTGLSEINGGEALSAFYIDVVLQNLNGAVTLYAVWETNPDYIAPLPPVDYDSYGFIGTWTATYNNDFGLLSAILNLSADGVYTYEIHVNGAISVSLTGE